MIDLRSDVMAMPTRAMWDVMQRARPGWMPSGEDEAVNQLESECARILDKEAGLFLPTGSMANLLALMTLGERGTQIVLEETSHIACAEEQGYAFVCGLAARLLPSNHGAMELASIEDSLAVPRGGYLPRTSLVCLENSHNNAGGAAIGAEYSAAVSKLARRHGAKMHLDGARLFNAAVALGVEEKVLAAPFDSVGVNLNKSLAAPYGAILCGSKSTVEAARKNAKRIGASSVHKAGLFAAAALLAFENRSVRAKEDNSRAARLAQLLSTLPGLRVDWPGAPTNIVKIYLMEISAPTFLARLKADGVLALPRDERTVRFVTHAGIADNDIERAGQIIASALTE